VPQVQVVEAIRQVAEPTVQQMIKHVPRVDMEYVERVVQVESRLKQDVTTVQEPVVVRRQQLMVPPPATVVSEPMQPTVITEPIVGGQIFAMGTEVEFFQEGIGWTKCIVQSWNSQGGFYVLDIHPNAHPSRVRLCQQAHWGTGAMMATQVLQPTQVPGGSLFDKLDVNHDGQISREEFRQVFGKTAA